MNTLMKLAAEWRTEAERLRSRYDDGRGAALCEAHAQELEQAEREYALEELSLPQAKLVSGYSETHLRNMVAKGVLENVGKKHKPRFRRGDLPRKGNRADLLADLVPARRPGPKPRRCA